MLEQKNKEQEALFGKYSIILPKFNKATKENSDLKSEKEKLKNELEELRE